jgi:hypothetical protein
MDDRMNQQLADELGKPRRNTDRHSEHRNAQLAIALVLTVKLINWRNRWSPIR